eukprot:COSAG01_NODE_34317_length_549_cov_6.086667_1_plen_145_part_10
MQVFQCYAKDPKAAYTLHYALHYMPAVHLRQLLQRDSLVAAEPEDCEDCDGESEEMDGDDTQLAKNCCIRAVQAFAGARVVGCQPQAQSVSAAICSCAQVKNTKMSAYWTMIWWLKRLVGHAGQIQRLLRGMRYGSGAQIRHRHN